MAGGALVSSSPYRPTPLMPPPSSIDLVSPLGDEPIPGGVLLVLPESEAANAVLPLDVDVRPGQGTPDDMVPAGEWSQCQVLAHPPSAGGRPQLLLRGFLHKVCQFRLRRGRLASGPSKWIDAEVWSPPALPQSKLRCSEGKPFDNFEGALRALEEPAQLSTSTLEGFAVALHLAQGSLSAQLAWPRTPPRDYAVPLTKYQVCHCAGDGKWEELFAESMPNDDSSVAESHVMDLAHGVSHRFSIRLCNAHGVWSAWSAPAPAVFMDLPAPIPGHSGGERVIWLTPLSPTRAKLSWAPLCSQLFAQEHSRRCGFAG